MGISYKNGSGYPDPTAHYAVRNIEQEEKTLHIGYPTGYMDIRLEKFFPCTMDKARKLFRLVRQYCPPEEKEKLMRYLLKLEKKYSSQIRTFTEKTETVTAKGKQREWNARLHEAQRVLDRTRRNMELLRDITGYGEEVER